MTDLTPDKKTGALPKDSKAANDSTDKANMSQGGEVFLNKDVRIRFNEPIPYLDKGSVKAFQAVGSSKIAPNLFALICEKSLTPRKMASIKYTKVTNSNLPKLVASGKVLWPPAKEERYCFIYENILGSPILKLTDKNPALGWRSELVIENIVCPIINILSDMRDKGLVHGEIWPGNIFDGGAKPGEKVKLGECLSTPASSQLPALYEPIERALADPLGKGVGGFEDELYSFGISLAVMLRTIDPLNGLSDEQIIERKIETSSYSALIGKDRLSGSVLELLRGLLYDDAAQRWTLDDVQAWMDGRRLSPKQAAKRIKATRPITLGDKKYLLPELLAKDMYLKVDAVMKLVESGDLDLWIDRAIEDKIIKTRMEQTAQEIASYEKGLGYAERLSVAIATTFYTECPVRYKGLNFIPDGFGKLLSWAYITQKDLQPYIDVLRHSFVMSAIRHRKRADETMMIAKFDSCQSFIMQSNIGTGIERCLYFLNPECPCLSSILKKYYVQTPEEMMDALEGVCSSSKPDILFDRHVVAFLSVKDRKNIDPYMADLSSTESYRRILGQLRTLATIQTRSRLGKFPAIAAWVEKNLMPVCERFRDAKKRDSLEVQVKKLVRDGDLAKIAFLFDNPKLYESDADNFHQAMTEYQQLNAEKEMIEEKLSQKKNYERQTGSQISSMISVVLSLVVILIITYITLVKG